MSETKRKEMKVVVTSVSSPNTIQSVANDHGLNPQEVFVRVNFKIVDENGKVGEDEYTSSNKLRFFGQEGYEKLLTAKQSQEPINVTLTCNEKGSLMYLNSDEQVEVATLFSTPVEKVDNRKKIEELF